MKSAGEGGNMKVKEIDNGEGGKKGKRRFNPPSYHSAQRHETELV